MSPQIESHSDSVEPRVPLRLRMAPRAGIKRLDGAWWPQGHSPALEVADLVDHFPTDWPRIARVSLSGTSWDAVPTRIRVVTARGGFVKVGSARQADTHTALLSLMDRTVVQLAVVPASLDPQRAERVLAAAVAPGNRLSPTALLDDAA